MASTFIPVRLEDFELRFNIPHKKDLNRRAFELIRPEGAEAYYECILRETGQGKLCVKVYTSIRSDRKTSRDCGEDAIRIVIVWKDKSGWEKPIGKKPARVYRAARPGSSADVIVVRALDRARTVSGEAMSLPICECGRPMALREGPSGKFYGCIGFVEKVCSKTRRV